MPNDVTSTPESEAGTAGGRLLRFGPRMSHQSYWQITRTRTYSLSFVLPLLLLYELLVIAVNRGSQQQLRNAADWVVRSVIEPFGLGGTIPVVVPTECRSAPDYISDCYG